MRDPQLSSRLPKPLAINVHFDSLVAHGFAIPLDFLLRCIAATTEVTTHPLAACFGLSNLVLVGFLPTLWTFHSPYFTHSFRHSPQTGHDLIISNIQSINFPSHSEL